MPPQVKRKKSKVKSAQARGMAVSDVAMAFRLSFLGVLVPWW